MLALAGCFYRHTSKEQRAAFFEQIAKLEASYPGGLKAYLASARKLLLTRHEPTRLSRLYLCELIHKSNDGIRGHGR